MICNELANCRISLLKEKKDLCKRASFCIQFNDKRSKPTCSERGKSYTLVTNGDYRVISYHMDGGIVFNEENTDKCDFLFVVDDNENPTAIFIELKGKDTRHAISQVKNSIKLFEGDFVDFRIYARIVNTQGIPRIQTDPDFVSLNKLLKKKYKGDLALEQRTYVEIYKNI
jgi:hypothetical protein